MYFTLTIIIILISSFKPSTCLAYQNSNVDISIKDAFPNLSFTKPVFLTHSNDGSNRIFVVEQSGRIKVFPNEAGVANVKTYLNIEGRVNSTGSEMGLLGLAFHPDYANNGFFFVNYTAGSGSQLRTVISRFTVSTNNSNQANSDSELIVLQISQPFSNHNGGMIEFDSTGLFYIATGDGGSGGDPQNNAQNRATLLGKILRIDVDKPANGMNYGIPSDNPFTGNVQGFREEIYAWGLRNPWRFSIDHNANEIWAGDVGQRLWEEVDLIIKGENYGWNVMEGLHCFLPPSNCDETGLSSPIVEYSHASGNCSITGGYIYRGNLQPGLRGAYICGDYCSGNIWMLRFENDVLITDSLLLETSLNISSFGVDQNNELYIIDHSGPIYNFNESLPTRIGDNKIDNPDKFTLEPNYPNPFNSSTTINYHLHDFSQVGLTVFNTQGQKIKTLISSYKEPGEFQVVWDGRNDNGEEVASGLYFYQLKANSYIRTHKMILLR